MREQSNWTTSDAADLYNLPRWSDGCFEINDDGYLQTSRQLPGASIALTDVVEAMKARGLEPPFIARFPSIIELQIRRINQAFARAIDEFSYGGRYRCFYPTKVNQHREVVGAVLDANRQFGGGVEAGSKAELLALLVRTEPKTPILCNGFKDNSIIELALEAIRLGRDVTIVIEKPTEVQQIIDEAGRIGVRPKLGARIKLAARSGGHWNSSGGARSKFGLTVPQLMETVAMLRRAKMLDCLYLLHFHPGSQISNIRKIKASLIEAARIYADLSADGVPLTTLDVGGGLAIDYTGGRSTRPSSCNYDLQEYANDVVYHIQQVCDQANVAHPDIISESGRAITAHSSLLIVPLLDQPDGEATELPDRAVVESSPILTELWKIFESISAENLVEDFHDTQSAIETVWQMFGHGSLSLAQRCCAEQLAGGIYRRVASRLDQLQFVPPELDELRHQLAETRIANFSLFQGVPDAWALDQVFPIMPIHRLDEIPSRRCLIGDITCDSDGLVSCFAGSVGGKSLPLHQSNGRPYHLGMFLIGAYQESLGDDHNLLGDYHVATVNRDGSIDVRSGATVAEVLEHVHHSLEDLEQAIAEMTGSVDNQSEGGDAQLLTILNSALQSYTYLSESSSQTPAAKQNHKTHSPLGLKNRCSISADNVDRSY